MVMITLEQDDTHVIRETGNTLLNIGFHIMKVEENRRYRVHLRGPKMAASDYIKARSVFLRTTLPKGRFVVIPSTENPEEKGGFLLRLFTSSKANVRYCH